MNNKINSGKQKNINRPPFLTALCLLTFIGSATGFLGYFSAALFFEKTSELIVRYSSWDSTESISPLYFTIFMALHAISLTGAIRMWKLHRDGFFIYVLSQLAIMFMPAVLIGKQSFSDTNAIFTLVFITGYALSLKYMNR